MPSLLGASKPDTADRGRKPGTVISRSPGGQTSQTRGRQSRLLPGPRHGGGRRRPPPGAVHSRPTPCLPIIPLSLRVCAPGFPLVRTPALGSPRWPDFNLITSVKTRLPNQVTCYSAWGQDSNRGTRFNPQPPASSWGAETVCIRFTGSPDPCPSPRAGYQLRTTGR